jgi:hypothetical protein
LSKSKDANLFSVGFRGRFQVPNLVPTNDKL